MQILELLREYVKTVELDRPYDLTLKVLTNPSIVEFTSFVSRLTHKEGPCIIRGISDGANLYLWDAHFITHTPLKGYLDSYENLGREPAYLALSLQKGQWSVMATGDLYFIQQNKLFRDLDAEIIDYYGSSRDWPCS